MSSLEKIFIGVAILGFLVGFAWHSTDIVESLAKAMCGVSMILFFIVRFFGEENA